MASKTRTRSIHDTANWRSGSGKTVRIAYCHSCREAVNRDNPEEAILIGDPEDRMNGYACRDCR